LLKVNIWGAVYAQALLAFVSLWNPARRVFGIPEFRFYALADGIKAYLFGQKRGLYGCFSSRDPDTGQRWLFLP
jgi:hypothetical protein